MAKERTVLDELDRSPFDFRDAVQSDFQTREGLTPEIVREISRVKNEPEWMRKHRLRSLELFNTIPMPVWGPPLDELDINNIVTYVKPNTAMKDDWADVPAYIKDTFERLGIPKAERESLAGVGAQYDSEVVYHRVREELLQKGVIYTDMETAVQEYEDLVRPLFMKIVPPSDHKFAALHGAFAATDMHGGESDQPGALRIIAEDLGIITKEVTALRTRLGLPGMRILQFAFDGHADNLYLPHNFETNTVVYTGTHDNDTTLGWWNGLAPHEQDYVRRYLGINGESIHWALIRVASASVASISIIPMQDVLGLDSHHRMNQPGIGTGYWEWRFSWHQLASWHGELLADLTRLHGRIHERRTGASSVTSSS